MAKRNLLLMVLILMLLNILGNIWGFTGVGVSMLLACVQAANVLNGLWTDVRKERQANVRKAKSLPKAAEGAAALHLTPSFESGLYGGLIGGTLAGLIIGLGYFLQAKPRYPELHWFIILEIVLYTSWIGTTLGAISQLMIVQFRKLVVVKHYPSAVFNEVSGGILGGIIVIIPLGILGGWYFGLRPEPAIALSTMLYGAVVGPMPIILGILLYSYQGSLRNVMRVLLVSLLIAPFLAMVLIISLQALGIGEDWFIKMGKTTMLALAEGAILGLFFGFLPGLQIGLALRLYRLWAPAQESKA
jgi:hypothetical protein